MNQQKSLSCGQNQIHNKKQDLKPSTYIIDLSKVGKNDTPQAIKTPKSDNYNNCQTILEKSDTEFVCSGLSDNENWKYIKSVPDVYSSEYTEEEKFESYK